MRWHAALTTIAVLAISTAFAGSPQTVVLDIRNMTCPVCPITVKRSLEKCAALRRRRSTSTRRLLKYDPERATIATLVKATTAAGYPSSVHQ